jgi:hypothetical protein
MEDWVCLEAAVPFPTTTQAWSIGDGEVEDGERLYYVGYFTKNGEGEYRIRRCTVVSTPETRRLPHELVFVQPESYEDLHGWSGCWVGRHHAVAPGSPGAEWEFVGIMVSSGLVNASSRSESPFAHLLIRPPPQVLKWLIGE